MHKLAVAFTVMTCGVVAAGGVEQTTRPDIRRRVDHLVYAGPDLQDAIERIDQLLGVRARPGGQHPGRGTRNALVALGPRSYLEIIGPDPEQPKPDLPRPFGIDTLSAPKLVTWAANESNLEGLFGAAAGHGVTLGQVTAGSRRRPDGVLLNWRYTDPRVVVAAGVVPFFIDWGNTPHPAEVAAGGASLVDLRAEHPDDDRVRTVLGQLGLDLSVRQGPRPALIATIVSLRGRVELR